MHTTPPQSCPPRPPPPHSFTFGQGWEPATKCSRLTLDDDQIWFLYCTACWSRKLINLSWCAAEKSLPGAARPISVQGALIWQTIAWLTNLSREAAWQSTSNMWRSPVWWGESGIQGSTIVVTSWKNSWIVVDWQGSSSVWSCIEGLSEKQQNVVLQWRNGQIPWDHPNMGMKSHIYIYICDICTCIYMYIYIRIYNYDYIHIINFWSLYSQSPGLKPPSLYPLWLWPTPRFSARGLPRGFRPIPIHLGLVDWTWETEHDWLVVQ